MGNCFSTKEKNRTNDAIIAGSKIHPINSILFEVCPSICKMVYLNEKGTGFLIQLYKGDKPLFALMTNEHIITEDMIAKNAQIEVYYYNEKKRAKIILNKKKYLLKVIKEN